MKTKGRFLINSILCIIIFISPFIGLAQNSDSLNVIQGTVRDKENNKRIVNATIFIPDTQIGTVTNSNGEFIIKISKDVKIDYFEVSHVGYQTSRYQINNSINKKVKIRLNPRIIKLDEIEIQPQDAQRIVMQAVMNIKNNYSSKPNNMIGFYRESIKQRRHYISISEAVVDIYKAPYSSFGKDQVGIFKGRKGLNIKKADTLMVQLQGGPNVLLWLDVAKHPDLGINLKDINRHKFSFSNFTEIDGETNYVIDFEPSEMVEEVGFYGKIFVGSVNNAITRIEFSLDLDDKRKAAQLFLKKKPRGLVFYPISTNYIVTYKKQDDKYYLNYLRVDLKFKSDWKRKLFKNKYTIVSEMAITSRKEVNVEKIPRKERFKSRMVMSEELKSFSDPEFWGDYNIIEPEQNIEKAIKKIMKKMRH